MTQQTSQPSASAVTIADVRVEHVRNALGIGTARPRLSWIIETQRQSWLQAAYQVEAIGRDGDVCADTGRVESGESVLVAWPFAPLASRQRLGIRVRVWGTDGSASKWSAACPVEAGLLHPEDWSAQFISPDWAEDTSRQQPAPMLRREFDVKAAVQQARLYVTALGVYEAHINGLPVGDHVLEPGWTSYEHRLQYQTFDVTALLRDGANAIGAIVGDGWYRGRLGFNGGRNNIYGDRLALLAQLEITYADGTTKRIVTDERWRAATGSILSSGIYEGETYDARLERPGWSAHGFDDGDWLGVAVLQHTLMTLVAPAGPPVRRIELIAPVSIFKSPTGRTLVDFGQNLVGRLRITVRGVAGQTITLRHAEVLEHGELGTRPLRRAAATDRYTLRGTSIETWEPRFTFHGFRYAEVEGWPGELRPEDINAVVLHSDLERTGWFECSDALVNKLHENVVWSMRGNFLSIPTDCPQRDERLGWTGDIQVFTPTASYLYDVAGFLQSWLGDLAAEQATFGGVAAVVVPYIIDWPILPIAAWGDAAVIVPWVLYQRFGDADILRTQFNSMRSWVDVIARLAGETYLWDQGYQLGDWLDPAAPPDQPGQAKTDSHLVSTAYFARSAELVGQAAGVLGLAEEAAHYLALANNVRRAFAKEYVTPTGRLVSDAQTAYALAIEFGLLADAEQRQRAGERLAALVRANGYHIGTGFVGTPLTCDALSSTGNDATAYGLVLQRECPSWLYPVTMGATTIWERWDSLLPDGSINPGEMTSFNHYALGAVADWLHRVVGGLAPAEPGYRRITFRPRPGGGLRHASARHRTPYGLAECSWAIRDEDGSIEVTVVVPPNTTASVSLPGKLSEEPVEVGSGVHRWSYTYRDPDAREPLTVDSSFDEFRANPGAWIALTNTLRRTISDYIFVESALQSDGKTTLRQALAMSPHATDVLAAIADALAELR